jgi:hypothetical protein
MRQLSDGHHRVGPTHWRPCVTVRAWSTGLTVNISSGRSTPGGDALLNSSRLSAFGRAAGPASSPAERVLLSYVAPSRTGKGSSPEPSPARLTLRLLIKAATQTAPTAARAKPVAAPAQLNDIAGSRLALPREAP